MNLEKRKKRIIEPVFNRRIERNKIKKRNSSNQIRLSWRAFQIKRIGISRWCYLFNKANRNSKDNYITPESAMYI